MSDNAMFELADRLKELREAKKAVEEELKSINAYTDEAEYRQCELPIISESPNETKPTTTNCPPTQTRARAAVGMKEELFDTLRSKGFGEIHYETLKANSLSAFVKEQIAENGDELPDWLKGLVNVFEKTTVTVRKAAR